MITLDFRLSSYNDNDKGVNSCQDLGCYQILQ